MAPLPYVSGGQLASLPPLVVTELYAAGQQVLLLKALGLKVCHQFLLQTKLQSIGIGQTDVFFYCPTHPKCIDALNQSHQKSNDLQ